MLQAYKAQKFSGKSRLLIDEANEIIAEYMAAGYVLTLRQLYYQFVSRDLLPNRVESYKRLGSVISDARLAGEVDWSAIEDRTRNLVSLSTWESPVSIVKACAEQFRVDFWADQAYRVEVWVEKEALAGVFERTCNKLRVPYIACRGYMSQSEMRAAALRFLEYVDEGKTPVVLHFGDHDPSGIDMSRDIEDRLALFMGDDSGALEFRRLALNLDQVRKFSPPPNPAKTTDARFASYIRSYGRESWELDALDPKELDALVRGAVSEIIDLKAWERSIAEEKAHRARLLEVARNWDSLKLPE